MEKRCVGGKNKTTKRYRNQKASKAQLEEYYKAKRRSKRTRDRKRSDSRQCTGVMIDIEWKFSCNIFS